MESGYSLVLAVKSFKQTFSPAEDLLSLMEAFRSMINECVRIGLEENKTSLKSLSLACYPKLKLYAVNSAFKLCAISRASGILKNYRKLRKRHSVRKPYCTRPTLTTCYGLSLNSGKLKLPGGIQVPLNRHTAKALSSSPDIEVRSVTLTPSTLSISVRRTVDAMKCTGMIGIDMNLNNVTMVDTDGDAFAYSLGKATEVKARCRWVKSRFMRNDVRVRERIFRKYGAIERNRVQWIRHNISAKIVKHAKGNHLAVVMEKLTGIRRLYRRGNGQGVEYRARMNSWSYYEVQRQIAYKAAWEGIAVVYANPRNTSARCSICGSLMSPEEGRMLRCGSCGIRIDRDKNAARNILAAGLRFGLKGQPSEAMVGEPSHEVILQVDGRQITHP